MKDLIREALLVHVASYIESTARRFAGVGEGGVGKFLVQLRRPPVPEDWLHSVGALPLNASSDIILAWRLASDGNPVLPHDLVLLLAGQLPQRIEIGKDDVANLVTKIRSWVLRPLHHGNLPVDVACRNQGQDLDLLEGATSTRKAHELAKAASQASNTGTRRSKGNHWIFASVFQNFDVSIRKKPHTSRPVSEVRPVTCSSKHHGHGHFNK